LSDGERYLCRALSLLHEKEEEVEEEEEHCLIASAIERQRERCRRKEASAIERRAGSAGFVSYLLSGVERREGGFV